MSDTDSNSANAGPYINRDPMYMMFTDKRLRSVFDKLIDGWKIKNLTIPKDMENLFVEIGFLFNSGGTYELNQHHELTEILQTPHIKRLLMDDVVVGVLCTHIGKHYLPCVPTDALAELTGFEESAVESAEETLRKFRLVRGGMVLEGKDARETEWDEAADLLHRVDNLIDLLDEDTDMVSVDELEAVLGETIAEGERDENRKLVIDEDEFYDQVKQVSDASVEEVRTTDNLSTLEPGTHGTTLNTSANLAKTFGRFHTSLIRHTEAVHEFCGDE